MAKKNKGRGKGPTIPRDEYIYAQTEAMVSHLDVTIDPVTNRISISGIEPGSTRHVISHARESGKDKIIASRPSKDFDFSDLPYLAQLKLDFDYLVAVDTNSPKPKYPVEGHKVSACALSCTYDHLSGAADSIEVRVYAGYIILDTAVDAKAEAYGWHLAIKSITNSPQLRSSRIGLVVDSELGHHVEINKRVRPYYADYLLPQNITLIYASSERTDTPPNQMIALCDKAANHLFSQIEKPVLDQLLTSPGVQLGTAKCFRFGFKQSAS